MEVTVLKRPSYLASGHTLPRLKIRWSAVSLSKFMTLTRCCRIGSSSCGFNNIPLVPKVRLPLLRLHRVGLPMSLWDFVPTVHGFVRAVISLHVLSKVSVFFPFICTAFEFFLLCLPDMMLCGILTGESCWTSCPGSPMQTAHANHDVRFCMSQLLFQQVEWTKYSR